VVPSFASPGLTAAIVRPYQIACLLYCFNASQEVLLLKRTLPPNRGLWSPCGGKLNLALGESPYACARREAEEEMGLCLALPELHLAGIISEAGHEGEAHWLMFLFEVKRKIDELPQRHREGEFAFFSQVALEDLEVPATDREQIWPLFWRYRGGFFAAHCRSELEAPHRWVVEETCAPAAKVAG